MLEVADIVRLHGTAYREQFRSRLTAVQSARSGTSTTAVRRSLEATSTRARPVAGTSTRIILAETGTAPSVTGTGPNDGWPPSGTGCSRVPTTC